MNSQPSMCYKYEAPGRMYVYCAPNNTEIPVGFQNIYFAFETNNACRNSFRAGDNVVEDDKTLIQ